MLRKKWIFWTATALLALVITSLWVWQQDLITKNATVQFGEESVRTIDLPFVASTEDRWVTIEFDVQILPLGSKRFVVYADDCLRNLQINGTHLPIENNCNRKDQEMDLSAYLHTGENRVHALIEDFGGIVEFSFTQKISYVPYALLNIILIVTLYVYSIYYFRTRHDKSNADAAQRPHVVLIAPVYNEEGGIQEFVRRCEGAVKNLPYRFSLTLINDGSRDGTLDKLRTLQKTTTLPLRIIHLSRNFGYENAMTAGIDQSDADIYIILDADLQDPPELMKELLQVYESGKHVVYTVKTRREDSVFRRIAFRCFHSLFSRVTNLNIPEGSGSFSLMSRKFVEEFRKLQESNRFIPGMRAYVGFDAGYVRYNKEKRHNGHTKQTLRKLTNLAFNAIFLFSNAPLWLSNALVFCGLIAVWGSIAIPQIQLSHEYMMLILLSVLILQSWITTVILSKTKSEVLRRPPYIIQEIYEPDTQ